MKKLVTSFVLAGLIFSFLPTRAMAENKTPIKYVSLGDSIAAGMTPYGGYDRSYADELKDYLEHGEQQVTDYHNFAVSGYTSEQLKNDLLSNQQIRQEVVKADVITIDIGANDLFQKLRTNPSRAGEGIVSASNNLQTILSTIDQLNPDVDVYVMEYYNAFAYYPQEVQDFLVPLLQWLNAEVQQRTEANGDTYVPTFDVISQHTEKYMPNPEDNHLNVKGYREIAKQFEKAIHDSK